MWIDLLWFFICFYLYRSFLTHFKIFLNYVFNNWKPHKATFAWKLKLILKQISDPTSNYMFKVNNRNTRAECEIYSKSTIKTPERQWPRVGVFIVNFVTPDTCRLGRWFLSYRYMESSISRQSKSLLCCWKKIALNT